MLTSGTGKLSQNALEVLKRRYLQRDENDNPIETPEEMFRRVARAMAQVERQYGADEAEVRRWEERFFRLMWDLDFMPNSPTLMNAGTGQGTLSACYVLDIGDSMEDIMRVASDQAMIEKFGGGIGFALSFLRPKGARIRTTQGRACGPVAVLRLLSGVGTMITQGGKRDGAHMAIMSVYHPDIEEFITSKNQEGQIHNFNISVGADGNFMRAVQEDKYLHLTWPMDTNIYDAPRDDGGRYVRARQLFEKIIHGAWLNGEPGMVWLDRINQDNTTPQLGSINATNPCGEQPLLSGESCNLGSINLANFVRDGRFDEERFREMVQVCVRFLDNVIDANHHPTEQTRRMNRLTRKIGLGVMGWADLLVKLDIPYDGPQALELAERVSRIMRETADAYSSYLGELKGDFPAFEGSTLNKKNGGPWEHMRNAWRLSIAPTGTISMIASCSSGIEPLFSLAYKKTNLSAALEGVELFYVNEELKKRLAGKVEDLDRFLVEGGDIYALMDDHLKRVFVTADRISPEWHVRMQAAFQKYVDSGISKTINLPNEATEQDIWNAYTLAWKLGCKGITVYRTGSREKEVLVSVVGDKGKAQGWPQEGDSRHGSLVPRQRPGTVWGVTELVRTGHGNLYVTVNFDDEGKPFEVFSNLGKAGGCDAAQLEAVSRLISLALRSGVDPQQIVDQLRGITCCPIWDGGTLVKSAPDAVSLVLARHLRSQGDLPRTLEVQAVSREAYAAQPSLFPSGRGEGKANGNTLRTGARCPDCSGFLIYQEGCLLCRDCGWSKCG